MTKQMLPNNIESLSTLYEEFTELFSWKVMNKADEIVKHRSNMAHRGPTDDVKLIQKEISKTRKTE
jgi:hypothetical protein